MVSAITPSTGQGGGTVAITGSGFSTDDTKLNIHIANTSCTVMTSNDTQLQCRLAGHAAGRYDVIVHVDGKGYAAYKEATPVQFTYDITMETVHPRESSFGGGRIVTIRGNGFDSSTVVKICENICVLKKSTFNELNCEVPVYGTSTDLHKVDKSCNVLLIGGSGVMVSKSDYFFYNASMTSYITSVTPRRGGTGGGVPLTIKGSGEFELGLLIQYIQPSTPHHTKPNKTTTQSIPPY